MIDKSYFGITDRKYFIILITTKLIIKYDLFIIIIKILSFTYT